MASGIERRLTTLESVIGLRAADTCNGARWRVIFEPTQSSDTDAAIPGTDCPVHGPLPVSLEH